LLTRCSQLVKNGKNRILHLGYDLSLKLRTMHDDVSTLDKSSGCQMNKPALYWLCVGLTSHLCQLSLPSLRGR